MKFFIFLLALIWTTITYAQVIGGGLEGVGKNAGSGTVFMVTPFLAKANSAVGASTSAVNYQSIISGPVGYASTIGSRQVPVAADGTIGDLQVYDLTGTLASGSYTVGINVSATPNVAAGSPSISCVIDSVNRSCSSVGTVNVTHGTHYIAIEIDPSSPAASHAFYVAFTFTSTVGQESMLCGAGNTVAPSTTAANFAALGNLSAWVATSDTIVSNILPTGGTISNLYAMASSTPGASATFNLYIEKNGADVTPTPILATITNSSVIANDTANSVHVNTLDTLAVKSCPSGAPGCPAGSAPSARSLSYCVKWVPDTQNRALAFMGTSGGSIPSAAATNQYGNFSGVYGASSTESTQINLLPTMGSKTLTVGGMLAVQDVVPVTNTRTLALRVGTPSSESTCASGPAPTIGPSSNITVGGTAAFGSQDTTHTCTSTTGGGAMDTLLTTTGTITNATAWLKTAAWMTLQ